MTVRALLLLLTMALAGCSNKPAQPPQPVTERESFNRSARLAFSQGHYAQAATLYEAALDQALIEDRPDGIIDARFNLALSETYLGRYQSALEQVKQADAERVRRQLGPDPELQLLRATIYYRDGKQAVAQDIVQQLLRTPALAPDTAAKAHFLAGLIAADRGDADAVGEQLNALPLGEGPGVQADRLELEGLLAGLDSRTDDALRLLDEAAILRSLDRDYRGMTRVLAAAGKVAEQAGRTAIAAAYFLRAGRSAAQRGEPDARAWLARARNLAERSGDADLMLEADSMLSQLEASRAAK